MKRLLIALLVVGGIAFYPRPTRASFCIVPDVSESFKLGRAVFLGEATDIVEPGTSNDRMGPDIVNNDTRSNQA